MADIGIRELKTHASEVIHQVKEKRARYVVTHRGRPMAVILPLEEAPAKHSPPTEQTAWDELTRLGEEIGRGWQSDKTSTELLSEMRR